MPTTEGGLVQVLLRCEISGSDLELIWESWQHYLYSPRACSSLPSPDSEYAVPCVCWNSPRDRWPLYSVTVPQATVFYPVVCLSLRSLCASRLSEDKCTQQSIKQLEWMLPTLKCPAGYYGTVWTISWGPGPWISGPDKNTPHWLSRSRMKTLSYWGWIVSVHRIALPLQIFIYVCLSRKILLKKKKQVNQPPNFLVCKGGKTGCKTDFPTCRSCDLISV